VDDDERIKEDEDEEGDLNVELQRAFDRGAAGHHSNPNSDSNSTLGTRAQSTRSPRRSRGRARHTGPGRSLLSDVDGTAGLVAEPDELSRRNSKDSESAVSDVAAEALPGSMTELGLGRDVRNIGDITSSSADVNATTQGGGSISTGVVEQVARARTRSSGAEGPKRPDVGRHEDTLD